MRGSLLLFGFLLGMKHALEADHVAAVATLAARASSLAERVKLAGAWGVGHASTIVVFGAGLLALGLSVPAGLARAFEIAVGGMLIVLGADVLRRLRTRRVHFHAHRHDDGRVHFHAHAHEGSRAHDAGAHAHGHSARLLPRALLVGGVHGLAGSAALVLLSLEAARSIPEAVAYLGLFAVGSILGMTALSVVVSLPLRLWPERLNALRNGLEGAVGIVTIGLGSWIALAPVLAP